MANKRYTDNQILNELILKRYGNDINATETYYWNGCYTYPSELKDYKGLLDLL